MEHDQLERVWSGEAGGQISIYSGRSLAEQLQAKKDAGLKKSGEGGDCEAARPRAAAPPKLDIIGEIKARALKKKKMEMEKEKEKEREREREKEKEKEEEKEKENDLNL